jgi:hypothetical protein
VDACSQDWIKSYEEFCNELLQVRMWEYRAGITLKNQVCPLLQTIRINFFDKLDTGYCTYTFM